MKLTLDEYSIWVSEELENFVRPAVSKGRKLLDEAGRSLDEARGFFDDLSRKADRDLVSKRDPVSYRAARVIGHSSREALESLTRLQLPPEVAWDSMKTFKDSLSIATRSLRGSRSQAAGELPGLYILDMRSFGGAADKIAKAAEKISDFLEREGGTLQKARALNGIVSTVQDARKELGEREEEMKSIVREQQLISDHIHRLGLELETLTSQGPLRDVLDIERALRKESREFRTETLAHLARPLRKLRDLSQRGEIPLGTDEREALNEHIGRPYRSFLSKKTGGYTVHILETLRSALQAGKMEFKPRKTARVLSQLEQILGNELLQVKQKRGRDLLSKRSKILHAPGCETLYRSRKDLMSNLDMNKKRRDDVMIRMHNLKEKSATLNKRLGELLTMAEARTNEYVGQQVQIQRLQ